jgi:CheY-like chemotaxis protein
MDGLETMRLVHQQQPLIPIIVISGNPVTWDSASGPDFLTMATKLGAVSSLQKPFKPADLLDSIRRPETGGDSFSFAIGCGLMWAISALIHGYLYYRHMIGIETRTANSTTEDRITVLGQNWAIWCGIAAVLAIIGALIFQKIGSRLFYSLVATEMKSKAPPILAYNIFGYCLGPSLLSIIPIAGPILAVIWIAIALMVGGATRLKISVKGSVIAALVVVGAMVGVCIAVWFIVGYFPPYTTLKEPPLTRGRGR